MSVNRPITGCSGCETSAGAMGCQVHNPYHYQVNQSPPPSWPSAELMVMQQCGLGYHAWLPWLAVQHPDHGTISFYWTKCVRCGVQEQYDLREGGTEIDD